jgi:hypothetical protein
MPQFADPDGELCPATGYRYNKDKLKAETVRLGRILQDELDLEISDMDDKASRFFKEVYINPSRMAPMIREDNVISEIE